MNGYDQIWFDLIWIKTTLDCMEWDKTFSGLTIQAHCIWNKAINDNKLHPHPPGEWRWIIRQRICSCAIILKHDVIHNRKYIAYCIAVKGGRNHDHSYHVQKMSWSLHACFLRYARGQTYIQTRRFQCFIPSGGETIKHHGGKIIQVFLETWGPLDSECLPSSYATGFQERIPNEVWV